MMDRNREYTGQGHTDYGERGKTLVEGLTMRDICDCYVRGVILASGHVVPELYTEADKGEKAELTRNDLYGWDSTQTDPGAIQQNMMCEVEKMMGIFPNLPEPPKKGDRMKLQEQFEEIEKLVEAKNQKAINDYLLANDMPNFIYELAGYKEIREKKVTKIGINVLKVCEKWIPSFKKRPTKKNVEEIITYNNSYFPTKDHIMFFYTYSYGDGSGVEGADTLVDIISSERISFNKEDLVPELKKMKELYEPREGHIKCHYCDRQRLPKDIHQKTIISRMYSNCESPLRNYCNDRPCASYDQMGSEG